MAEKLLDEVAQGKIIQVTDKPVCIHALGAVVKKKDLLDTVESIRPITDCSCAGDGTPTPCK